MLSLSLLAGDVPSANGVFCGGEGIFGPLRQFKQPSSSRPPSLAMSWRNSEDTRSYSDSLSLWGWVYPSPLTDVVREEPCSGPGAVGGSLACRALKALSAQAPHAERSEASSVDALLEDLFRGFPVKQCLLLGSSSGTLPSG